MKNLRELFSFWPKKVEAGVSKKPRKYQTWAKRIVPTAKTYVGVNP